MTALGAIEQAMRLFGALAIGESAEAAEAQNGLTVFNQIIGQWSKNGYLIFHKVRETFTLTAGQPSRTIGSGANFATTRPDQIDQAGIVVSGSPDAEYPLKLISSEEWALVSAKDQESSIPTHLYYETSYPLGKVWLWPVPSTAYDIALYYKKPLTTLAALTTELSFPVGYEMPLIHELASVYCRQFGKVMDPQFMLELGNMKSALQRSNLDLGIIYPDDTGAGRRGSFDIYSGPS